MISNINFMLNIYISAIFNRHFIDCIVSKFFLIKNKIELIKNYYIHTKIVVMTFPFFIRIAAIYICIYLNILSLNFLMYKNISKI